MGGRGMKVNELIRALESIEDKDREIVLEIYSDLYDTFYKGVLQSIKLINHRVELCGDAIMMTDYDDYLEQFDLPAQGEPYGGDFVRKGKSTEGRADALALGLVKSSDIGIELSEEYTDFAWKPNNSMEEYSDYDNISD
jgi:hypothetical protein